MCCIKCIKSRKFKNPTLSYMFDKALVLMVTVVVKLKKYLKKKNELKY